MVCTNTDANPPPTRAERSKGTTGAVDRGRGRRKYGTAVMSVREKKKKGRLRRTGVCRY